MRYSSALDRVQESIIQGEPAPAAPLLRPKWQLSVEAQLTIYIEGYSIRLRQAVRNDYPCLEHYLGEAAMNGLIDAYIKATPSRSYNLDFYPFGFWRFVQEKSPHPEAGALAELEGAIAETFMLPGSEPLILQDLSDFAAEDLGRTVFKLRAATRLLRSTHDVEDYMQAFKRGETVADIAVQSTCLFVYRHNHEVRRQRLEEDEHRLLTLIGEGKSFDAVVETLLATEACDEEKLSGQIMGWLPRWINEGFFAR